MSGPKESLPQLHAATREVEGGEGALGALGGDTGGGDGGSGGEGTSAAAWRLLRKLGFQLPEERARGDAQLSNTGISEIRLGRNA